MSGVRRLLALVLLLAFGMPLVAAAAAGSGDVESQLPACCRRNGQHHCSMTVAERTAAAADGTKRWQAPLESCPYCPSTVTVAHADPLSLPSTAQAVFAGFLSHPTPSPQVESRRRISRDRSRHKRGPPSSLLL